MWKRLVKTLVPRRLFSYARKKVIVAKQHKAAALLKGLVDDCDAGRIEKPDIKAQVTFPDDKPIIWQYWAQGMENVPPMVRICMDSVDRWAASDFRIIRLCDANLADYIEIPTWLNERVGKKIISTAHFSDILRCMLLSVYGGLWLDACTLLTGKLPSLLFQYDFFAYQRDSTEEHKRYWESTFAYYWGWDKEFRVNMLAGIMYAKAGNKVVSDIVAMFFDYWKKRDKMPDYFFFQILFDLYIKRHKEQNCPIYSDSVPHMLRQVINGGYPYMSVSEILNTTTVHSLNYKDPKAADNLRVLLAGLGCK